MAEDTRYCPTCKIELINTNMQELIKGEGSETNAKLQTSAKPFYYFTFLICHRCGFTQLFAGKEIMRMLEELLIDQGHG
jgi:hypothetical protein